MLVYIYTHLLFFENYVPKSILQVFRTACYLSENVYFGPLEKTFTLISVSSGASVIKEKDNNKPNDLPDSTNKGINQRKTDAKQNTNGKPPNKCESTRMSDSANVMKVMATEYDKLKEFQAERTSYQTKNHIQKDFENRASETSTTKGHGTAAWGQKDIPCEKQASDDKPSCDNADKKKQDNVLKKEGVCRYCLSEGSILRCTGCINTFYCSKVCQKKDRERHKNVCENRSLAGVVFAEGGANRCNFEEKEIVGICFKCGKPGYSKIWSQCREVFYCSKQCQQEDWSRHEEMCEQVGFFLNTCTVYLKFYDSLSFRAHF